MRLTAHLRSALVLVLAFFVASPRGDAQAPEPVVVSDDGKTFSTPGISPSAPPERVSPK